MWSSIINGLKGVQTGASGAASSGVFGAGGQNFLGGQGTALGAGAVKEFGAMPTLGANASQGMAGIMEKFNSMTPEQSLQIATQMAQFGAPPPMQQLQAPQIKAPQYSQFVQPQMQSQAGTALRSPLGV